MLDTLRELCLLPGVSSDEGAVARFIIDRAKRVGSQVSVDNMGSVIAFKSGTKRNSKKLMLCAHMDEIGLMITYIHDSGYLSFGAMGGIDPRVIMGKRVYVGDRLIPGIIAVKPPHLSSESERQNVPEIGEMLIDIGANSGEEAERIVSLGDTVSFDSAFRQISDDMVKAKAIDDRVGCAVMLKLMEENLPIDCHFAFTVQEELGCRGAFPAAFGLEPDMALVLEGTTAADLPGVDVERRICAPGDGVVIPFMDGGTVYDRDMYKMLTDIAEKNGISWQTKKYIAGGTDAQAIQRSRGGVKVAALSAAVRNIHSPASIVSLTDIEDMYRLAYAYLEELAK